MFRTCHFEECQIQPLHDCLNNEFIPSLLGRDAVSELERDWISLPTRFGGLGLFIHIGSVSSNTLVLF